MLQGETVPRRAVLPEVVGEGFISGFALGFVATYAPWTAKLQRTKIEEIMSKGIPSKEAGTFLGAIAFLRRMIKL